MLSDENVSETNFVKYYHIFTFLCLNYINYLAFIEHPDLNGENLPKLIDKIKKSTKIIKNMCKYVLNINVQKIVKTNNMFILHKLKKYTKKNVFLVDEYIKNIRQMEKISELPNDNMKKILNLIIYRYGICQNENYQNFHNFYTNKLLSLDQETKNKYTEYIKQIPNLKQIINITTSSKLFKQPKQIKNTHKNNYDIAKILTNIIEHINDIDNFDISENNNNIIIKNNSDDIIKIIVTNCENVEFNQYQSNHNFTYYNVEELQEFYFLKKSFSSIEIKVPSKNFNNIDDFNNLTNLLDFIHYMTISIKIISSSPSNIYECLYPIEYTNYYYDTFYLFFKLIKNEINTNYICNKFVIDIIKFIYIYSYYDYYFYFSNNLIETIINKIEYKNHLFNDFILNLKSTLKLPKELLPFPPFFNVEYDINAIIHYTFEIQSYYKFIDIINALNNVYENENKNKISNIYELISKTINFDNNKFYKNQYNEKCVREQKTTKQIRFNSKSSEELSEELSEESSNTLSSLTIKTNNSKKKLQKEPNNLEDLKSNLDSDIINNLTMENKILLAKPNTYIELVKNDLTDCILNTEI